MEDSEDEVQDSALNLDISEGPRKVLCQIQTAANLAIVATVCLSRKFPSPRRAIASSDNVLEVLEEIVRIPKLQHLRISYASGTFPIHLLVEALANCERKTGRKATIESIFLLGAKMAYSETVKAARILKENPAIYIPSVSLESCTSEALPIRGAKGRENPLDILLSSLTQVETLKSLSLSSFHKVALKEFSPFPWLKNLHLSRVNLTEALIHNICQSLRLESFHMDSMLSPNADRQLAALAESLATNHANGSTTNLHTLRLAYIPGSDAVEEEVAAYNLFWETLECQSTLKELDFTVKGIVPQVGGDDTFGIPIASALEHNTTLQRLSIMTRVGTDEQSQAKLNRSLQAIAGSFQSNAALQHFSFHLMGGIRGYNADRIHPMLVEPFCKVFEDGEQYTLRTLSLEYRNQGKLQLTEKMQFQLNLNQAGRYKLLKSSATHQDWIDAVVAFREDVSISFFFLSRNPSLLSRFDVGQ